MNSRNDRLFKVKFIESDNLYGKIKFNKTENTFKTKSELTPTKQDIYYDEIIYYDGGNVEGYGDD